MGWEGRLSPFLFSRFNLFRFSHLDGQLWLFMLSMMKTANLANPCFSCIMSSGGRQTCFAVQPNAAITGAFSAFWVESRRHSFIDLCLLIICVPWTPRIVMLWAVNITNMFLSMHREGRDWVRKREGAREGKSASRVVILMLIKNRGAAVLNI